MRRWIGCAIILLVLGGGYIVFHRGMDGQGAEDDTAPAPGTELGNLFEGYGSANWGYGRYAGSRGAVSMRAGYSKTLDRLWLCWKTAKGYGAGNYGTWTFELQSDNPAGHVPSGKTIARLDGVRNPPEGYFLLDLPNVPLTAGQVYHLVLRNTDPDPAVNWSSLNTIMSTAQEPWRGEGMLHFDGKTWTPWGSRDNYVAPGKGSRPPYLLQYTDGTVEGLPYYSAMEQCIYGETMVGEQFPWQRPDTVIAQVGIPVYRYGTPAGPLKISLMTTDGTVLAAAQLAVATQVGELPTWRRVALDPPVTLRKGFSYRLALAAPACQSQEHCYAISVPYSSEKVPGWQGLTWGGAEGRYVIGRQGAWVRSAVPADLTFSLLAGSRVQGKGD